jgi:DNA-binding response OmpR family regulator
MESIFRLQNRVNYQNFDLRDERVLDLLYQSNGHGHLSSEKGNADGDDPLCIDDEAQARRLFKVALEDAGYCVLIVENRTHGLRLLEQQQVDLILVDILIPDMDGLELILRLRKIRPDNKIIAISGGAIYLDITKHLGANDTLLKPFSVQELLATVSSHLN